MRLTYCLAHGDVEGAYDGAVSSSADPIATLPDRLLVEVADCGFYPTIICRAIAGAVGERRVTAHLVHHEATFAGSEAHRHLTVLVLVDGAFVICHADEGEFGRAIVSTEVVKFAAIDSVVLTQSVADPASPRPDLAEAWLTVIWGATRRIDVGPAACDNPTCEADHGYTGVDAADDYVVRMSRDADGVASMHKLVEFGNLLQAAVR
ncbi:DUF5998 family protein [uncultured Tessaracoccus sp.]|uniref:DUF5998 family protein n=1 Tax=uncultured Tessaracoccus sp. TaxID=905023 RepID=UPI0026193D6B|nr:DUF5998 family protein [uncultured Tessaracoccus sp.]